MSESFVSCRRVCKRFGSVRAVDDVHFGLERGNLLALLGPSGCGKTTLLRIIAGFENPDDGEIAVAGRVLNSPSCFIRPEKRRVGMVFQDFALFPHLDVGSNIAFGLPKGIDRKARVSQLLQLVGLERLETRMPHELSGGQQQRVSLARALAADPDLLLLDEPFSNLDPSTRYRVRAEVKQLIQSVGITAIFVTHDQEEALSLAERVGIMISGRLLQIGTPAEIYARPVSREIGEFVGGANFLAGHVRGSIVECEMGRLLTEAAFEGPADVMIRAEDIVLSDEGIEAIIQSIEYFGHDQMLTVRLLSGLIVRVRLSATLHVNGGQRVHLAVAREVVVFPVQ